MQGAQAASHQSRIKFLDLTFLGETPDTGHCLKFGLKSERIHHLEKITLKITTLPNL